MGIPVNEAAMDIPRLIKRSVPQKLAKNTTNPMATPFETFVFRWMNATKLSKYRDTPTDSPIRRGRTILLNT